MAAELRPIVRALPQRTETTLSWVPRSKPNDASHLAGSRVVARLVRKAWNDSPLTRATMSAKRT